MPLKKRTLQLVSNNLFPVSVRAAGGLDVFKELVKAMHYTRKWQKITMATFLRWLKKGKGCFTCDFTGEAGV